MDCFNCLSFTPLVNEGFPFKGYGDGQTHNIQRWTDEIVSSLLVTYTHSLGEEDATCH